MPHFDVTWVTADGRTRSGAVEAPDRCGVATRLRVPPAHVLAVRPHRPPPWERLRRQPGLQGPALQGFSHQLAVLLNSGLGLHEALMALQEKEAAPTLRRFTGDLLAALERGESFSAALQSSGSADPLLVAMVVANERSGQLAHALDLHARYMAWAQALRARIVAATVYPLMLIAVGLAVVLFLLLFVLPRFAGILEGVQDLPWSSRALLAAGALAERHPLLSGLVLTLPVLLGVGVYLWPAARRWMGAAVMRWPGIGARIRTLILARLFRGLGLLLGAGVPALQALQLVRGLLPEAMRPALHQACTEVAQGRRLSEALEAHALTTVIGARMVRVGERSGNLAVMLERAALFHEDELQQMTEWVTKALNPILMLVIGAVVGGIIVLMYLPIFQLVEQVG